MSWWSEIQYGLGILTKRALKDASGNHVELVGITGANGQVVDEDNPLPVALSSVDGSVTINADLVTADTAMIGAVEDAAVTNPAANGTLIALTKGIISKLADIAAVLAGYLTIRGYGFDVVDAPVTSIGAYAAGNVVGGYREIDVARVNDEPVLITGVQIACKANVTPNVRIVIFGAAPGASLANNVPYTLSAADVLCVRKTLSSVLLGASWSAHGATVKSLSLSPAPFVMKPIAGTKKIGYYLIDDTGVALASTSDIQVRFSGVGA